MIKRLRPLSWAAALPVLVLSAVLAIPARRAAAPAPDPAADEGHCTVIMVGKDASTDGSVMSTHAADCGVCDFTWRHVPAADHKPGEKRRLYNIDQIRTWPPSEGGKWAAVLKDPTGRRDPPARPYLRLSPFHLRLHERPAAGHRRIDDRQRPQDRQSDADTGHEHLHADAPGHGALRGRPARPSSSWARWPRSTATATTTAARCWPSPTPARSGSSRSCPSAPLWTPKTGKPGAVWAAQRVPDDEVAVCTNESLIGEIDLGQPGLFHGLGQRRVLRRRGRALRPEVRPALQLEEGLFADRGQRREHGRAPLAHLALLRPRRPVAATQARDAGHGLPVLGQARPEALGPGRHGPDPRQVAGDRLRPGPRPSRRPLPEPELLQGDAPHQRAQRRVHDPDPVPVGAPRHHRRHPLGGPGAPRTPPATSRSMPGSRTSPSPSRPATTGSSTGTPRGGLSTMSTSTSSRPTARPSPTSGRRRRRGRTAPWPASRRSTRRPPRFSRRARPRRPAS